MDIAEIILSVLGSSSKPIDGRTALQKIVYFSSIKINTNMGYRPHFYGPYSSRMAQHLENLISMDYISEEKREIGYDCVRYSYSLTKDGKNLVKEIKKEDHDDYKEIKDVVNNCYKIANNNIHILSMAAKVYILLSKVGYQITFEETKQMGKEFGWELSDKSVRDGANLLVSLGLVSEAKEK